VTAQPARILSDWPDPPGRAVVGGRTIRLRPGLLRAPPFGRGRTQVSATQAPDRGKGERSWIEDDAAAGAPGDAARRVSAAVAAMREAKVGGAFWGARIEQIAGAPRRDLVLVRRNSRARLRPAVAEALERHEAASLLVSLPSAPWARQVAGTLQARGIAAVAGPLDPWSVLPCAREVWAGGDDPVALLALMAEAPVRCLEPGDAAGWGLTDDGPQADGRWPRTLADLAHAALFSAVVHRSPFRPGHIGCEEVIGILADWRRGFERARGVGACVGMSRWKRRAITQLMHSGAATAPIASTAADAVRRARRGGVVAVWATRTPPDLAAQAEAGGCAVWQVEDGFLRSVGLGSALNPPCSIVLDRRGLHYDPARPSDLEILLQDSRFDPALLARAERLIATIVARGLSKYNLPGASSIRVPPGRRLVLVPGQVADDQSVRLAGADVGDMIDLLARVRALEPEAHILYKPHPDVEAGLRPGAMAECAVLRHADQIVRGAMPALLEQVHAVHTLSSLSGFEALLRRREVIVHGQPFYAGWGLTRDLAPLARRARSLTLAELAAGALILYPLYRDPLTGLPCPPEVLVDRLAQGRPDGGLLPRLRQIQGRMIRAFQPRAAT
jgi:capsular polysaccharide export protein